MVEISYHKFLKITGISEETFKATSIERKKKSLLKQGFEVQSIKGRGVKAIFYCKENLLSKQKNEVQSILGVDTKHPDVMLRYLELMKNEENLYKSDFQLAKEVFSEFNYDLQTLKKYFCIRGEPGRSGTRRRSAPAAAHRGRKAASLRSRQLPRRQPGAAHLAGRPCERGREGSPHVRRCRSRDPRGAAGAQGQS